jgi:hypothetical protein
MRQTVIVAIFVTLAFGCHARFKAAVPNINTVQLRVHTSVGPQVRLGKTDAGGVIGAVINIVQEVRSVDQTRRLRQAIRPEAVEDAVLEGMSASLDGHPFSFSAGGNADALLDMDVRRYGLYVAHIGAPGTFDFIGKLKIYDKDSQRIYAKRLRCRVWAGDPTAPAIVFRAVNNVRTLKAMSDEDINNTFADVANYCGQRFVMKMRKHAG